MAHYVYEGQHFELPDGLDNEAALNKIKTHLGQIPKKAEDMSPTNAIYGAPEAALSMVAGLPGQIAGGLYGLGTLLSGQGLDKAADASKRVQENNFGFGQYEGTTEVGKRAVKKAGELMAMPGEFAADYVGGPIGKVLGNEELGRLSAKLPVDTALNFLPLHLGVTKPLGLAKVGLDRLETNAKAKKSSSIVDNLKAIEPEQPAPTLDVGKEFPAPIDKEYMARRQAEEAANAAQERLGQIQDQITQRQAELERGVRDNIKRAEVEQILARLEQEREAAKTAADQATNDHATMEEAARQRELLSTGENTPGGKIINRPMATESSGVMGEIAPPEQGPVGLSTGENVPGGSIINRTPVMDSGIMGLAKPPETPPVGLSTGEGGVARGSGRQRAAGPSNLMGEMVPTPHDPFGSIAGRQRKRGQSGAIDFESLLEMFPTFKGTKVSTPVYHGTTKEIKGEFKTTKGFKSYYDSKGGIDTNGYISAPDRAYPGDLGTWFSSTPKGTDTFAGARTGVSGGNVHQSYLNLQNPKEFATHGDFIDWFQKQTANGESANKVRRSLIKEGFDGISIKESLTDGGGARSDYVAFQPEQIKSAISPSYKNSQRGGLNFKDISEGLAKLGSKRVFHLTPKEKLVTSNLGVDYNPKGSAPQDIVANALAEGKDAPSVFKNWQSGLANYGDKVNSTLATGVSRWLSWGEKEGVRSFREKVQPIEKELSNIDKSQLEEVHNVLKHEMFEGRVYSPEQLKAAGMSEAAIAARAKLRAAYDDALAQLNASREKMGMKPLKAEDAYFSSMWTGNWHIPIYDKEGKLVWYVKTESRGEANKAIKWIGENHGDAIDVAKLKPEFKPSETSRIPKDVTETYAQMMELFKDSPIGKQMEELMKGYKEEQAFNAGGFSAHFKHKSNVRGFLGDRPWLSDHENAKQGMKAQIDYLKEAYRWAPMQEAIANVKEVLGNTELAEQQPNNMAMAKAYTGQALGIVDNMFKAAENNVAKAFGTSPRVLGQWTGGLKSLTYLQQLGLSAGYAIATPTQAFILGPSRHMLLSESGIKHNPIVTMLKSSVDTAKILTEHAGQTLDKRVDMGLSSFGKDAMKYMEDNSIISVNLFDEYSNLGEGKAMNNAKTYLGYTISMPEKLARVSTFLSFAHHLNDGGFKGSKLELFRQAEELTNDTLTNMRRSARPLAVGKAGLLGELAYTYKSPMINYYNNLSTLARRGLETKNPIPFLMAAVAMPALLGGAMDIPMAQELDGGISLLKKAVAKWYPQYYKHLEGFGIKEALLRSGSDVTTYGVVSKATGAQMASRFSNQVVDPQDPFGGIAPVATEIREQASLLKAGAPLLSGELPNSTGLTEAAWQNAPPAAKGWLENYNPRFQTGPEKPDGTQGVFNPHRMNEKLVDRTKSDRIYRNLGLTSLPEARTRDIRYLNNSESKNLTDARAASIEHLQDNLIRGNKEGVTKYAKAYFDNYGDAQKFDADFNRAIEGQHMTPEQRQTMKANTLAEIMNVKRRLEMERR